MAPTYTKSGEVLVDLHRFIEDPEAERFVLTKEQARHLIDKITRGQNVCRQVNWLMDHKPNGGAHSIREEVRQWACIERAIDDYNEV